MSDQEKANWGAALIIIGILIGISGIVAGFMTEKDVYFVSLIPTAALGVVGYNLFPDGYDARNNTSTNDWQSPPDESDIIYHRHVSRLRDFRPRSDHDPAIRRMIQEHQGYIILRHTSSDIDEIEYARQQANNIAYQLGSLGIQVKTHEEIMNEYHLSIRRTIGVDPYDEEEEQEEDVDWTKDLKL